MIISYAGFELLLNDPEGAAARFVERYIDQRRNALFGREPTCIASQRQNPNGSGTASVTIPIFNYPERPPLELNQLYWPGGAMRWACFCGLVDGATLSSIVTAISEELNPDPLRYTVNGANLILDDEQGGTPITAYMHLLTPRKITPPNAASSAGEELWLLPLVDVRYFWQLTDYEPRDTGAEPSFGSEFWTAGDWQGMRDLVGAQIARMIGDVVSVSSINIDRSPVATAYLTPYGGELQRPSECPALLLDAIAANIGGRVVFDLPGRVVLDDDDNRVLAPVRITDTETAERDHLDNLQRYVTGQEVIAGDSLDGINDALGAVVPERIRVCFRDPTQSYVSQRIDVYAIDLADPPQQFKDYAIKVFHDTFYCPPATWNAGDEIHEANSGLTADQNEVDKAEALAYQIAEDYFFWMRRRYDIVLPGLSPWRFTGYDDAILYTVGAIQGGEMTCTTRVWSYPPDVAPCTLTHGNSTGGGPYYQVVSHPFTTNGGGTGGSYGSAPAYRVDRSDYVWCLPLPYADEGDTIRWAAEPGTITADGESYDSGTGTLTTYGVEKTLKKVYFNKPWTAASDSRFSEFVGAVFPLEIFKANAEQTAIAEPGAANHSVTGTVTAVDSAGIEILLANGSKILAERTAGLDTWAVNDTAVCWFAEGRYLAANTACSEA